jgi:hypothetical protein
MRGVLEEFKHGVVFVRMLFGNEFIVTTEDLYTGCPKKIIPFFLFSFLGAQCVESGVSCTDCY